jgi:SpoVK/Ycf46/Vps4 family AAA+-type ATPase
MVNTAALSAIRERIAVDSKSGQDQQNKDVVGKSGNIKHTRDRLKVSMRHFQSAIEKVNRKSKALSLT